MSLSYSGRTDSGVHASGQVVCFNVNNERKFYEIIKGCNRYLPEGVEVLEVESCDVSFHPRFNAKSRCYSYVFTPDRIPFYFKNFLVPVRFIPNPDVCMVFSNLIQGTHDFRHIRKKGSTETITVRTILRCELKADIIKDLYDFEKFIKVYQVKIEADGFLYRMVRNLMGLYFGLETQKLELDDIKSLLGNNEKNTKIIPAPACGLSLLDVMY